jgi:hypothetical protein
MARKGGNQKACDKYKMSGHKEENKRLRKLRHEKRLARFAKRKEDGKCYSYSSENSSGLNESNVGSNQARHTNYAKLTSIFRKLNNQIAEETMAEKARIQNENRDDRVKTA